MPRSIRQHTLPHARSIAHRQRLRHTYRRLILTGATIAVTSFFTGCGLIPRPQKQTTANENDFGPPIDIATRMQNDSPISKLALYPNGPGLVICNPVASAGLSDFGQGAGGWLEVETAGQTQFGRSPAFANLRRAAQEMHAPDLALDTPERADRLVRILGATDVALGTLTGNREHCQLTYRLYKLANNSLHGAPISAQGSEQQVAAQLPAMAAKIARQMGAAHPNLPASTGLTAADLEFLGPLTLKVNVPQADLGKLQALAPHATLAAALSLRSAHGTPSEGAAAHQLITKSHVSPIAVSEVAIDCPEALVPDTDRIEQQVNQNPENYLYALTSVWLYRQNRQPLQERKAAESTMQCAPDSPDAWLTLGYTISNEAQGVRHAKAFDSMTPQEQDFVSGLYPDWVYCTKHATELDPFFGKAWLRLATACAFDGDRKTADSAFWQAVKLDPEKADVYRWGLEMYQPKWFDDPAKLANVAGMAANENYATKTDIDAVAEALDSAGFDREEATLRSRYPARS